MIFAVYLLISGITLPILVGCLLFKKIKKGVKPIEENQNNVQVNECES